MLSAEGWEEGEDVIEQPFAPTWNAVETGVETRENPCRLPECFHSFQ